MESACVRHSQLRERDVAPSERSIAPPPRCTHTRSVFERFHTGDEKGPCVRDESVCKSAHPAQREFCPCRVKTMLSRGLIIYTISLNWRGQHLVCAFYANVAAGGARNKFARLVSQMATPVCDFYTISRRQDCMIRGAKNNWSVGPGRRIRLTTRGTASAEL